MKNIQLISASAGSGKTYFLMEEIAKRVVDKNKPIGPEQIMATTFTNKAANELQERIRMRLLQAQRPQAAQRVYDGQIGTVNAVCARLLKEFSFEAGISPAVDILPEEEVERIFQRATSEAIDSHAPTLEPIALRLGLTGKGSGYSKQGDWRESVREIVNLARSNDMDASSLRHSAQRSWATLESLLGASHTSKFSQGQEQRLRTAIFSAVEAINNQEKVNKPAKKVIQRVHTLLHNHSELSWRDWMELENIDIGIRGSDLVKGLWEPWASANKDCGDHLKQAQLRSDMQQMIGGVFNCAGKALESYADYKNEYGMMDFTDQEALVLAMVSDNSSFSNAIKERFKLLLVDEFQDTSPIQLALFIQFSTLVKEAIWVGDQKQAIYGFRGTDPVLMSTVAESIEQQANNQNANNILPYSWRSKRQLVEFCNAVFAPTFHQIGANKVALRIPQSRAAEAEGGWLESWTLEGNNKALRYQALATGIQSMIQLRSIQAGDIAVLCRSNKECELLSTALFKLGIRASVAQGDLLATHECTLALAALRYLIDPRDTIALTEIIGYSSPPEEHQDWFQALAQHPERILQEWSVEPLPEKLRQAQPEALQLTPLETLELAIAIAGIEALCHAWGDTVQRMRNLDQLRAACTTYQDQCKSRHGSATVKGFLIYLSAAKNLNQAEGFGPDTVNVLTYHKAKGLEWPVVIMGSLNQTTTNRLFGTTVQSADQFDVQKPLAGRWIRFWPWPYGTKKKAVALGRCLENSDIKINADKNALNESQRLLYVGMTRAKQGLVLVREKTKKQAEQKWLDELQNQQGTSILSFSKDTISVTDDDGTCRNFTAPSRILMVAEGMQDAVLMKDQPCYLPARANTPPHYPPATQSPSSAGWGSLDETTVTTRVMTTLGGRLPIQGKPNMADFGNALHGFLGADCATNSNDKRQTMATRLLDRWHVTGVISATHMQLASDRLNEFIVRDYPAAHIMREWPMTMILENHQRVHGWLDLLLELADGYIIIDHKSYPGHDDEEHAKKYAPQLATYKQAIELATAKPVLKTLIHLPVSAKMIEVCW